MPFFGGPLEELAEFRAVKDQIERGRGPIMVRGCLASQKAHLIHELSGLAERRFIITYSETAARELCEDLRFFDREVLYYPVKDLLFFDADVKGNEVTAARIRVLKEMLEKPSWTVVTTVNACMEPLPSRDDWAGGCIRIDMDTKIPDIGAFARELVELGYKRETQAEAPGQFAVRGGLIDIYPLCEDDPVRIELWGEEIDSIRTYDAAGQRSLGELEYAEIFPAALEPADAEGCSFITYAGEDALIVLDEPAHIQEMSEAVRSEFTDSIRRRKEQGMDVHRAVVMDYDSLCEYMSTGKTVAVSGFSATAPGIKIRKQYQLETHGMERYAENAGMLRDDLRSWADGGWRAVLLSSSPTRAERSAGQLREDCGLKVWFSPDPEKAVVPGEIMVTPGKLRSGFAYPQLKFALIPDTDMFGSRVKKKRKKRYEGKHIDEFARFEPGDYVVHENHGMGVYRGIEQIETDGIVKDYIKVEYAAGAALFVPVTQSDLLQKYSGAEGHRPRLNRLGGQEWNKTKSRVRKAVADIAGELVELYAVRQTSDGFEFAKDSEWQREFEELFPYELTHDQEEAVAAVKADMESSRIMDRLICGDVGFGKTEVALRAAFKAVQSGKQVAFLVPTTVLAQQHTRTFRERLEAFAVNVGQLSRFQTPAEQKKILKGLEEGSTDIVIGTHRLLSDDVHFHDLGLLIVDEEQRFGVTHKEKIKHLREDVDTLTLTATPIPRTLHMSLIGIRDMSVLEEPPQDRVPIQTYVMEYHEELAREAIIRELERGGQVYYVYNRVRGISEITQRIRAMVPDARVEFAHGQMAERKLEQVMLDFVNGEIDVLVSTTIIETGLDIPNVNTILIHNSDRFGLSQLYQLKGRVGRSNRTAYAFLFYRVGKVLNEEAEKRLRAIREFTELGSGVRIAMKDLEIRGAGNLLGAEQHGHMEAVGYDLYCKLLNEAIMVLKGGQEAGDFETSVDLPVDAFIPEDYIASETVKMEIYKRISGIGSEEDLYDVTDELIDRFGPTPAPVENLLSAAFIRASAHRVFMTEVALRGRLLTMKMFPRALVNTDRIPVLVNDYSGRLRFTPAAEPCFTCEMTREQLLVPQKLLSAVKDVVCDIAQSLVG